MVKRGPHVAAVLLTLASIVPIATALSAQRSSGTYRVGYGPIDRQLFVSDTEPLELSGDEFVAGLPMLIQNRGEYTVTITATVSGGPVEFRFLTDTGKPLAPGTVRFASPDGSPSTHSATFVASGGKATCRELSYEARSADGGDAVVEALTAVVTHKFDDTRDGHVFGCG